MINGKNLNVLNCIGTNGPIRMCHLSSSMENTSAAYLDALRIELNDMNVANTNGNLFVNINRIEAARLSGLVSEMIVKINKSSFVNASKVFNIDEMFPTDYVSIDSCKF